MGIIIDAVLVIIVLFCIWRGFRNGLIRGVAGVVVLVVSIFVANLVATAYSGDFSGMLSPFISGIVDTALVDTITSGDYVGGVNEPIGEEEDAGVGGRQNGPANTGAPESPAVGAGLRESRNQTRSPTSTAAPASPGIDADDDEEPEELSEIYHITYTTLRKIGLPPGPRALIARQVSAEIDTIGRELSASITAKLSDALAYVAIFAICFILLEIIFAVAGNLANLIFSLPGLHAVDKVAGCVFGLAKGAALVLVIALIFRYFGLLMPRAVEGTYILNYLINNNPVANILGI